MLRRLRFLAISLAAASLAIGAVSLAGCKSCNDHALDTPATDAAVGSLTPEQASKVLARIDDQTITLGDFAAALDHIDQFDRLRYQSPERRKELLDDMINLRLLAREAKAKGYDQDPVAQEEERSILRNAMLAEARDGGTTPNDVSAEDVKAYYDAHRADFHDPERRRVSVIVTKDEGTAKQALEAAKQAPTASAFGEIVKARSIDPQAKNAQVPVDLLGDLGMVSPPGDPRGENARIAESVRAALFQIPTDGGIYPSAVKTGDTWTIVRLTGISTPRDRTLAEADRAIRVKLSTEMTEKREAAFMAELKAKFPVTIDEAALATVRVDVDGGGIDAGSATPMLAAPDAAPAPATSDAAAH